MKWKHWNWILGYQVCISSATCIVLHAQNPLKSLAGRGGAYDSRPDPIVRWWGAKPPVRPHHPRRSTHLASTAPRFRFQPNVSPPVVEHLPPPCFHHVSFSLPVRLESILSGFATSGMVEYYSSCFHWIAGPQQHRFTRWNRVPILSTSWDISTSSLMAATLGYSTSGLLISLEILNIIVMNLWDLHKNSLERKIPVL